MADALDKLGLPEPVAAALRQLGVDLKTAAGPKLLAMLLYGSVARGRFHVGRSDINLLVQLSDASAATLALIAPVLRAAWRAFRIEPFLLTPADLAPAAAAFPIKFLDIKRYHVLLVGENPLAGLEVPREHVRFRIEQELRNLSLRLRRR